MEIEGKLPRDVLRGVASGEEERRDTAGMGMAQLIENVGVRARDVGHDGIAEIAVVGIPDERTGERACAVIVTADQPAPALTDLRELLMRQGIAKFKIPEQVEIWDALPKNDAGKVLKHRIRAMLTKVDV